jgi:photosystem II stability/assembly factor-like uncharacterized protein
MSVPHVSRFLHVLVFVTTLNSLGIALQAQAQSVGASKEKWQPIYLPFRPVNITGVGASFWVCGADEMIARSDDAQTWHLNHQTIDGEVLLTIGFLDKRTGYAAGTNGTILWTKDGGETWTSVKSGSENILDISFVDDQHGIRRTQSGADITSDGGLHWSRIPLPTDTVTYHLPFHVLGIATTSATHFAVSLAQTLGEHVYLSTTDGGSTWNAVRLDDKYAGQLFVHAGEYWAFGIEYLDRQNHGGYGAPVELHSSDGEKWAHGVRAPTEFESCTSQGCILNNGVFADLYGEKPRLAGLPADESPTPVWAIARQRICTIGLFLQCGPTIQSENPAPRQLPNRPIADAAWLNALGPTMNCLLCPLKPFPLSKSLLRRRKVTAKAPSGQWRRMDALGLDSSLDADFLIRKDGTVDRVRVENAPNKEIESAALESIRTWLFDPPRVNGEPVETERRVLLAVSCFAFATNDGSTCSLSVPSAPAKKQISSTLLSLMVVLLVCDVVVLLIVRYMKDPRKRAEM